MSNLDLAHSKKQSVFDTDENPHIKMTSATKDVFEGRMLIDRLLVYYGKFDGSREKATRYAQKLLDLGHIESLTNGITFQDSPHVYRWADANRTMCEVRHKRDEEDRVMMSQRNPGSFQSGNSDDGKSILRISIETDNCQNAEIKANIRASPRENGYKRTEKRSIEPKSITTIEEDSFFGRRITKTLSYLGDDKDGEETGQRTPYITDVSSPRKPINRSNNNHEEKNQNYKTSYNNNHQENVEATADDNSTLSSPRKKPFRAVSYSAETKDSLTMYEKGQNISTSSRTDANASEEQSPGTDVQSTGIMNGEQQKYDASSHVNGSGPMRSVDDNKARNSAGRAVNGHIQPPTLIASTQTSEKSILEASKLYKPHINGKRSPSPAPRSFKSRINKAEEEEEYRQKKIREKELDRVNGEKKQKKTQFSDEIPQPSFASEERSSVTFREQTDMTNGHGMLLHSNGNAERISEEYRNGFDQSQPPLSPPPPSPKVRIHTPVVSTMKSLFWTKISKSEYPRKNENNLWDDLLGEDLLFDEDEFEKLFSKPSPSPQTPRLAGQMSENGRVLKVLGMQRSREVGIRASSVRIPVEEIHDAILNMDDEKLSLEALQTLCDVKPSPNELDQIAEALKARPDAILDKPEQFVLMLAMIPSLEERLKCWIFAQKFPDKIIEIQEHLLCLNDACNQIMQSATLKRVLELVLVLGNRMNKGSQRGEAYGFHLDILPKLKDVKSQNGEINLLQYLVKVLRQQMKLEGSLDEQLSTPRSADNCGLPETELLQKALSVSLSELGDDLEKQAVDLKICKDKLMPIVLKESTIPAESELFESKFQEFFDKATEKLRVQAQLYHDVLLTIEDFLLFFLPHSETKSKEPFFTILRSFAEFTEHFRRHWTEAQKEEIKEEFYKIQKYKKNRQAEIQVKNTPSALKERFLSRRRPNNPVNSNSSKALSNGIIRKSNNPSGGASTSIPKKSYKFEEVTPRSTSSNGRNASQEQSYEREESSLSDRSVENAFRIEKRMQELQAHRYAVKR